MSRSNVARSFRSLVRHLREWFRAPSKDFRRSSVEQLERRDLFDAGGAVGLLAATSSVLDSTVTDKPVWVGGVYIEEDAGSDAHGDSFYVTFQGGATGTRLTQLVISTDQGAPGYSVADNLFDTDETPSLVAGVEIPSRGADHSFPFQVLSLDARDPNAKVTASVLDGSMQIVLTFENFYAGDRLHFSIDVDEVQHLYSLDDIAEFNEGLDPITSGAEFEGSRFTATFSATHFEDVSTSGTFLNRYDTVLGQASSAGLGLDLPADNDQGRRDRTAGIALNAVQKFIPAAIGGAVYLDNNDNGIFEATQRGLAGVTVELISLQTITGQ